jgi:hypothetical protein
VLRCNFFQVLGTGHAFRFVFFLNEKQIVCSRGLVSVYICDLKGNYLRQILILFVVYLADTMHNKNIG